MKKILFKPEMVHAILEGRKTQTRRIHKDMSKPRYNVGDVVYVGEAYCYMHLPNAKNILLYKADANHVSLLTWKWTSGMFMPEKYARIKLKITRAWLQPLCTVTHSQARLEGFGRKEEFFDYFFKISPKLDKGAEVWAYTFEVLKCG